MIVVHLPSPRAAQRYRVENLYAGPMDDAMAAAVVGPPTLALLAMRRSAFAIPKALPTKSVKLRCTATRAQGTARHRARCVCVTRSPSVQSEN